MQREKRLGGGGKTLRDQWDYNKRSNICVMEVEKAEEKEGRAGKVLEETMAENFKFSKGKPYRFKKLSELPTG